MQLLPAPSGCFLLSLLVSLASDSRLWPAPTADVSHQAYSLLQAYLQRFPYASLGRHEGGQHAGKPYLILDDQAAWQPLAAAADFKGLSRKYIFEEAIKASWMQLNARQLVVDCVKGGWQCYWHGEWSTWAPLQRFLCV